MNKIIALTIIIGVFMAGCTQKTGLANPAAVYCEEQGHTYEIKEGEAGQYGVCMIDGEEKDAWQYYRESQDQLVGSNCGTVTPGHNDECCRRQNKEIASTKDCQGNWFYDFSKGQCDYYCYEEKLAECNAETQCSEGQCVRLGSKAYCVTDDPCSYANCQAQDCVMAESYPLQLFCS